MGLPLFGLAVGLVIVLNVIVIGISVDAKVNDPENLETYKLIETGFTIFFVVEMFIRLSAFRLRFFLDGWYLRFSSRPEMKLFSDAPCSQVQLGSFYCNRVQSGQLPHHPHGQCFFLIPFSLCCVFLSYYFTCLCVTVA